MSQNYPTFPNQMSDTNVNFMNQYQYQCPPSPLVVVQPNQINQAAKNMETNIIHNQQKIHHKQETEHLKEKIQELQFKNLENKIDNLNLNNLNRKENQVVVVNNNNNNNNNIVQEVVVSKGRLKYSSGMYCLFLCLNIFLPGIGTIVAAGMYGKTSSSGDRTGELICHGVVQFLTSIFIFGWVWAILEATRYFEEGVCC